MNSLSSRLSSLFVLTALLMALTSFSVDWLMEFYAPMDPFDSRVSLLESQRKSEQLSREVQRIYERIRAKDRVLGALIRGEMALSETAARFRSLHEDPRTWHHPLRPKPAYGDGAGWCREVIEWAAAKVQAERSVNQSAAVRQRLEAELDEQLEYPGAVTLPE